MGRVWICTTLLQCVITTLLQCVITQCSNLLKAYNTQIMLLQQNQYGPARPATSQPAYQC